MLLARRFYHPWWLVTLRVLLARYGRFAALIGLPSCVPPTGASPSVLELVGLILGLSFFAVTFITAVEFVAEWLRYRRWMR